MGVGRGDKGSGGDISLRRGCCRGIWRTHGHLTGVQRGDSYMAIKLMSQLPIPPFPSHPIPSHLTHHSPYPTNHLPLLYTIHTNHPHPHLSPSSNSPLRSHGILSRRDRSGGFGFGGEGEERKKGGKETLLWIGVCVGVGIGIYRYRYGYRYRYRYI